MDTQPIRNLKYYYTLRKDLMWHAFRRWQHRLAVAKEYRSGLYERPAPAHNLRLSTCVITMNAASRIAPLIAHAKTFSDEVVIGVDSKTTDDTFDVCQQAGADVVFWIHNDALTCNAGLEQLVKACSGDWIVRLDDDEYLEPQFLKIKDALIAQDYYTHYKFPRLHISGIHPLRWVNDSYLYPDYQMRLFKNDLSMLKFPGAVGHTAITSSGPKGRICSTNIVHLNLAINSRQQREAKLERYIVRHHGGWVHPINEYALLYENFAYRIEPYQHSDKAFCDLLTSVVLGQRQPLMCTEVP
jgi:glycosyltransferase involved in cell wall biosynthesis